MNPNKFIIVGAVLIYTIAAVFSTGFFHPDEHFQLVEFAEFLAGRNTPDELAWEYEAQIRPTLQPTIVFLFFSLLRLISITNPYLLILFLRIVSGFISLIVITYFIRKTNHLLLPRFRIYYSLTSYFIWFLPFINVRFSSESYSGLAIILAIAISYSTSKTKYFWIGTFLALGFIFRFQTAFMSIGFLIWLFFVKKVEFKNLPGLVLGGVLCLTIGVLIDSWFYENFVITFINYFKANIIENIASTYGVSPWYYYFSDAYRVLSLPIALLISICFIIQLFNPKNFVIWVIVPFLIIHVITPHKELRFLFPILNLIPILIMLSTQRGFEFYVRAKVKSWRSISTIAILLAFLNFFMLLIAIFSPADGIGRANITQKIHNSYHEPKINLWIANKNPYQPIPVDQNFYRDKNIEIKLLDTAKTIDIRKGTKDLIVLDKRNLDKYRDLLVTCNVKEIISGVPIIIVKTRKMLGYSIDPLVLYEISKD